MPFEKYCDQCGVLYPARLPAQRFCSRDCRRAWEKTTSCSVDGCDKCAYGSRYCPMHQKRMEQYGSPSRPLQVCVECGSRYAPSAYNQPRCSQECQLAHKKKYWRKYYDDPDKRVQISRNRTRYRQERLKERRRRWAENYCRYQQFIDICKRRVGSSDFTATQLELRMSYFGFRCWVCDGAFEAIDHVKPISKGGPQMLSNLRPICRVCNGRKHAIWPYSKMEAVMKAWRSSEVI